MALFMAIGKLATVDDWNQDYYRGIRISTNKTKKVAVSATF
jgi:hypothetical protein